jgi:hypothetical protein
VCLSPKEDGGALIVSRFRAVSEFIYIVTQEAAILAQRRINHRKVVISEEDITNALTVIPQKVARFDVMNAPS